MQLYLPASTRCRLSAAADAVIFTPQLRAWHKGYTDAGGRAELQLLPPFESDGHRLFVGGISIWRPLAGAFFMKIGL